MSEIVSEKQTPKWQVWQVWLEPTELGKKAFKWVDEPVGKPFDNKDDADLACYELSTDCPAPDQDEYYRYTVRGV